VSLSGTGRPDVVLQAVAAMTAWTDAVGDRKDPRAVDLVLAGLDEQDRDELIRGLASLAGLLLLLGEAANGWVPLRTLQFVALVVVQDDADVESKIPEAS
jgi:hypothetical protein